MGDPERDGADRCGMGRARDPRREAGREAGVATMDGWAAMITAGLRDERVLNPNC